MRALHIVECVALAIGFLAVIRELHALLHADSHAGNGRRLRRLALLLTYIALSGLMVGLITAGHHLYTLVIWAVSTAVLVVAVALAACTTDDAR